MSTATLPLPPTKPPCAIRTWTVDEYHQMIEAGIIESGERCELLEGMVVPKMSHNPPHAIALGQVEDAVRDVLPNGWHVRTQLPITTSDSEPEPDLVVARGARGDFLASHPCAEDIALVAEVADSSRRTDLKLKPRIYARAGIAEYWVIDVVKRTIEVFTKPTPNGDGPRFTKKKVYTAADAVPLTIAGKHVADLPVAKLLPAKK